MSSKREEALRLAEELLADIELERIKPASVARKASRLARLIDDVEAIEWLGFEVSGFPNAGSGKLTPDEWGAAVRSGRHYVSTKDGVSTTRATVITLSQLQAGAESSKIRLESSDSTNFYERNTQQNTYSSNMNVIEKVVGTIYQYTSSVFQELRFGSAVSTAFDNLRSTVDRQISSLVPGATPVLTTALENAQTDNPEQWRNAAQACRDLVKATADSLRPPGPDVQGPGKKVIKMGDSNYVNRLIDWIDSKTSSKTKKGLVASDLEHLGNRLDAATDSGNKGAHAAVTKLDASRFIVGTYILLGDILSLNGDDSEITPESDATAGSAVEA